MQHIYNKTRRQVEEGFTLIELIIVMVVLAILTPIVLVVMDDLYASNTASLGLSVQNANAHTVLRTMNHELANITGWETSLAVDRPLGPTNSTTTSETWSYCGKGGTTNCTQSVNRVLIAYTSATNLAPTNAARLPVFVDAGSCDTSLTSIVPVRVAHIYFVAPDTHSGQNNLYRRTILNPGKETICGGITPYQKTTCAPVVITNAGCKDSTGASHTDAMLLPGVTSFKVDYYATANGSAIASPYTGDPNTIATAQSIKITVTTEARINGTPKSNTADIRITRPY